MRWGKREGYSWGAMRKYLEREYICDALKGRVRYFATRYREPHDEPGRVAIRIGGKEVYRSDFSDWYDKFKTAWEKTDAASNRTEKQSISELAALKKGGFNAYHFYDAFYEYHNQSIEKSLYFEDPIVRLFAVFNRRVGKRTLIKRAPDVENQPEWLRSFYRLRYEAEGLEIDQREDSLLAE